MQGCPREHLLARLTAKPCQVNKAARLVLVPPSYPFVALRFDPLHVFLLVSFDSFRILLSSFSRLTTPVRPGPSVLLPGHRGPLNYGYLAIT